MLEELGAGKGVEFAILFRTFEHFHDVCGYFIFHFLLEFSILSFIFVYNFANDILNITSVKRP